MQLFGLTDRGSVRKDNQDSYACKAEGEFALGVVCDGMGGARAGNVASSLAVEIFSESVWYDVSQGNTNDWAGLLNAAAEKANKAVFRKSETDEECRGMGTTLVAAAVYGDDVSVLNIGDSRCYLVNAESITQITRDHSLVTDLVERGDITPEEARCHPQKNLITRALGVERMVRADLFQLERQTGNVLLLCSDGLSNMVTDLELLYEIVHGGELETCCQRLLDIALSRGAPDNVTAVLVQL